MSGNNTSVRRGIKWSRVDVDPREQAIIVHYELAAAVVDASNATLLHDQKEMQKV